MGRELAGQLQTIPRDQDYTRVLRQELERAQRASRVDVLVPDGDAVQ